MISVLAVYSDGQVIEMATIGREGCTDMQAVFGAKSSARYFAQIPGNSSQRRGQRGAHQGRCAGAAARRAGARLDLIAQERKQRFLHQENKVARLQDAAPHKGGKAADMGPRDIVAVVAAL